MTKPEQMLKLAQIVEPDKEWFIIEDSVRAFNFIGDFYPENNDAQLMQVVFVLWEKGYHISLLGTSYKDANLNHYSAGVAVIQDGNLSEPEVWSAGSKEKREAIVNLAIEVLL